MLRSSPRRWFTMNCSEYREFALSRNKTVKEGELQSIGKLQKLKLAKELAPALKHLRKCASCQEWTKKQGKNLKQP